MTTFLFSEIDNGDSFAFDPETDVLSFDSVGLAAADFRLSVLPNDAGIVFTGGGKSFTLTGVDVSFLGEGTVTFADGSMLVNSCPANGYAMDLSGTAHDDLLLGTTGLPMLQRVSETQDGVAGNNSSGMCDVSTDGRYVVFESNATNLSGDADTNDDSDIFLKDTLTGAVTRVSTNSDGEEAIDNQLGGGGSVAPHVSADGRYVIFTSDAFNLVDSDTNHCGDVFLKDTLTGAVVRVSESASGTQANNTSFYPTMSADSRYVAFTCYASNLVAGDTNQTSDVFVKDLDTGAVVLASSSAAGVAGNADADGNGSGGAKISADGHFVVFESYSSNLVSGDVNASKDVFVKNLATGGIVCVSTDANGAFVAGQARDASISSDGRYVVFESSGALLHDGQDGAGSVYRRDLQTGELERVTGAGEQSWYWNGQTAMSDDGRYVVFTTSAALVDSDTNETDDVYVKDMQTGTLARVSMSPDNQNIASRYAQISADGSTIVFYGSLESGGGGSQSQIFSTGNPLMGRTLRGGAGDDVYQISNPFDRVVEMAGQGTDTVRSSVSLTLSSSVEKLLLMGTDAINGTGNGLGNTITGNSAANEIEGGAGNDTLNGAGGSDTASYAGATSAVTVDLAITSAQATGGAGSDMLISLENLRGSAYADHLNGTASANRLDGGTGQDTLSGGAGDDVYVVDSALDQVVEAADAGNDTVIASFGMTLAGNLENLTLTGAAALNGTGNAAANIITGNTGDNVLDGKAGADTLVGGDGADTYIVDNIADTVVDSRAAWWERDVVRSTVSFTLSENVEDLVLTGTAAIKGTGNSDDNKITGNSAANVIEGGAGNDTLIGGAGDDTYVIRDYSDTITESASGGTDLVKSAISYTLGAELENLTLLVGAEDGSGNDKANRLTGNSGNNTLDGHAGADTMTGGAGNDTYVIDNAGDQVVETASGGYEDSAEASVSWTMAANVEVLTLTGSGAINGTGNALNNQITGNDAANVLDGGAGGDALNGGRGNDTYIVDSVDDQVTEYYADGGTDSVESSVSYTLDTYVENLTLTGSAAIDGNGNALANTIIGNSAANVLNGSNGADSMTGGAGNDTYFVENAGDKTIEAADGGEDLVRASISFSLQAQVEELTLTGTAAINGTGNSAANTIVGNSAANTIDGKAGTDTMTGGAGNDIFAFTTAAASDLITDFTSGADKLRLSQAAIKIGDGDTVVEGAVSVTGPNGFANSAELVIITHDISGSITASSAAAAIGHANSAYQVGDNRLFVVDNGIDSAVYRFRSADANATITASELTLVASLDNTHATVTTDYLFGA